MAPGLPADIDATSFSSARSQLSEAVARSTRVDVAPAATGFSSFLGVAMALTGTAGASSVFCATDGALAHDCPAAVIAAARTVSVAMGALAPVVWRLGASHVAGMIACSVISGTVKAVERRAVAENAVDRVAEADDAKLVGEKRERGVGAP